MKLWAEALNIPPALYRTGQNLSLQEHYRRYLFFLNAKKRLAKMTGRYKKNRDTDSDGSEDDGDGDGDGDGDETATWPSGLKLPSSADIGQIFVGRSTYYHSWKKAFPQLSQKYPEMVSWLTSQNDRKSDLDLWGKEQSVYHFQELLLWIKLGKTLVPKGAERRLKKGEDSNKSHKAKDKGKGKML